MRGCCGTGKFINRLLPVSFCLSVYSNVCVDEGRREIELANAINRNQFWLQAMVPNDLENRSNGARRKVKIQSNKENNYRKRGRQFFFTSWMRISLTKKWLTSINFNQLKNNEFRCPVGTSNLIESPVCIRVCVVLKQPSRRFIARFYSNLNLNRPPTSQCGGGEFADWSNKLSSFFARFCIWGACAIPERWPFHDIFQKKLVWNSYSHVEHFKSNFFILSNLFRDFVCLDWTLNGCFGSVVHRCVDITIAEITFDTTLIQPTHCPFSHTCILCSHTQNYFEKTFLILQKNFFKNFK